MVALKKVKILSKVTLRQVEKKNRLFFRIARKKIHQNFRASKYDAKQPSDVT